MPDNSVEIARLEELLNSGTKRVAVDGQSMEFDLAAVERRLAYLKETDTDTDVNTTGRRPRSAQINLGGSW